MTVLGNISNQNNTESKKLIKVLEPWADYVNDIPLTWEIVKKTKNILINEIIISVNSYQTDPWININTIIA